MPVEPIPCDDGGGTPVEVTTCCAPAIASAPLCLADGTTILAVVRSGCVECGEAAPDPEVVGWLDTAGTFTPGALPADAGPCDAGCLDTICRQRCDDTDGDGQADATYSELYCIRADGTAELVLTYQDDPTTPYTPVSPVECTYGCPESETVTLCDETGAFLRRYTWLNGVGTFEDVELDGSTPHVVTGTVGACAAEAAADCLDMLCRQRCDDTDGDGQADATYSELWCVRADGTAELVLTYQDDPSTPYEPVSPVDCEYSSETAEALPLCDDAGPFLRRYSWLAGNATFEDVELDGSTPHVVTGTVRLCPTAPDCESPTTPAATLGLCLADGTPIAVLVTRSCDGTVTQDGWLNLTSGAYSAGDPPAGTMACGNPRSITTAGTFCDVDPASGDVLGLVLIEYTYGPDGDVTAVRLVDATTGQTYTPQGEVTTCPAGVAQPERDAIQLCDTATDGTVTAFLRDYARDENGAITGHTDYLLDGTPYTVTGTVGVCPAESTCLDCTTHVLCDTDPTPPATIAGTAASGTLANGVAWTSTAPNPNPPQRQGDGAAWWGVAVFPNPAVPTNVWTFDRPVNVDFSVVMNWSPGTGASENQVQIPAGAVLLSLPPGYTYDRTTRILRAGNTLTGCTVSTPTRAAGARFRVTGVTSLSLRYLGTRAVNTACQIFGHWAFGALDVSLGGPFLRTVCRDCTGATTSTTDTLLDGTTPYAPTGLVGVCQPSAEDQEPEPVEPDTEVVQLCDVAADGSSTAFLRRLTFPAGGGTPTVTDTDLDGTTPYAPAGTVGVCQPEAAEPEPCRNTSALLVCDLPTDGEPTPAITDTPGAPYYPYPTGVAAAGAQALWDGGTLTLPDAPGPQPGTTGTVRTAAAIIQAPRPACDAGTARVTVQVDVTQLGPDNGCASTGFLGLYNGTGEANRIALALAPPHTPAGWSGTLTVEADVPADDLAAGNVAVLLAFDAYDDSGTVCPPPRRTGWQLSEFDATVVYDQAGCETQILRTVVTDCETGAVLTVTDTTLDGQPYTVTGEVGQCTAAGGGECCPSPEPCGDTEVAQLCDLTYDPQAPIPTPARDFTLTGNVVAANDGTTLWFAQANQPADGVAELTVSGLLPATLYEFSFASAWIGAGAPDPANNNAVYRLDILDGAAVLATRTRNVSNGSSVFPGGVLTEDLPALAFIAPATGAVTIRFTDLTTGGPVNDRDLFLMPLEVRTAVLTVTRTPFLRRLTFACDGALTSSQDLDLDGITPYEVEGEVGHCTGSGEATAAVTPCDVQNVIEACRCDDTDGDGLPDVGYVELLAVDCDGQLTSLGTYTDGLTEPYSPVSPVDCNAIGDDEGADPAHGVQARRVELTAGAAWDAAAWPALQSVTAVAHSGTGTITTADGPSTLRPGESVTWSVARDVDAALTGPLTITAVTGTVTVSYTIGVTL